MKLTKINKLLKELKQTSCSRTKAHFLRLIAHQALDLAIASDFADDAIGNTDYFCGNRMRQNQEEARNVLRKPI